MPNSIAHNSPRQEPERPRVSPPANILISVVSHNQGRLVENLWRDFSHHAPKLPICLTLNVPEPSIDPQGLSVTLRVNAQPKGFGANHNAALKNSQANFFCILNPDIHLLDNPFPRLIEALNKPSVALVAPRIMDTRGHLQDSARRFPTLLDLLRKWRGLDDGRIVVHDQEPVSVPWVAGMFLLVRADAFLSIGGFDEKFFLYYEDVDLCARLRQAGWQIHLCPAVTVVHDAQRSSHKNWRYARWHLSSLIRYFVKHRFFGRRIRSLNVER